MTLTTILFFIDVLLLFTLIIFIKVHKKTKEEKELLESQLKSKRDTIDNLMKFVEDLNKIKHEESNQAQEVNNAQTDEDINNIVAGIIADNNKL